jgi:hypothetical protein
MEQPTAEEQLRFLINLQRLLAEGQFVATYKYALLLALADIAVESGRESGQRLKIDTKQIAEKFIQYYWRQCVPYIPRSGLMAGQLLRQNTGQQAAIIRLVTQACGRYGNSLTRAQRDTHGTGNGSSRKSTTWSVPCRCRSSRPWAGHNWTSCMRIGARGRRSNSGPA